MSESISDFKKYYNQEEYTSKLVLREFNKPPHQNCFFRNLEVLRVESIYVGFDNSSWRMRPDKFCSDYYKNHNFYPIILLVNNISTLFKFTAEDVTKRVIIAPKYKIIIKILDT